MKTVILLFLSLSPIIADWGRAFQRVRSLQPKAVSDQKTTVIVQGCSLSKEFNALFQKELNGVTLMKKFENGKLLGKGSFGEVKEVTWGDDKVAIKKMALPQSSFIALAQAREISFIKKMEQFNGSMKFIGCLETNKSLYYITEKLYKDLIDPDVLLTHKKKDPLTRVKLYSQLVRKFKEMHSLGITHQDIKPANLMVKDRSANDFRIIDFGMGVKENDYVLGGTPLFNSPDKIIDGKYAKKYYDVYALALTIAVLESTSKTIFSGVTPSCVNKRMTSTCFVALLTNIKNAFVKHGMKSFLPIILDALDEKNNMSMSEFEKRINELINANEVQEVDTFDEKEFEDLQNSKMNADKFQDDPVKARNAGMGYLQKDKLYQENPKLYGRVYKDKKAEEEKPMPIIPQVKNLEGADGHKRKTSLPPPERKLENEIKPLDNKNREYDEKVNRYEKEKAEREIKLLEIKNREFEEKVKRYEKEKAEKEIKLLEIKNRENEERAEKQQKELDKLRNKRLENEMRIKELANRPGYHEYYAKFEGINDNYDAGKVNANPLGKGELFDELIDVYGKDQIMRLYPNLYAREQLQKNIARRSDANFYGGERLPRFDVGKHLYNDDVFGLRNNYRIKLII